MSVFPEISDYRFCSVKRLLAIRNPFLVVAGIQKLSENIMIAIQFRCTMKLKLPVFPQAFQLCKVFSAEEAGNNPDRKEEIFSIILPVISRIKAATKDNCMDTMTSLS